MSEQNVLRSTKPLVKNPCKTVGEYYWKMLQGLEDDSGCVIDARTDQRLTVGAFKKDSNSVAVALLKRGVTKSDVIAFSGSNSIQHLILRFVAHFLGLTFIPLSPTFDKYEVQRGYKSSKANLIFCSVVDLHKFSGILEDPHKTAYKMVVVFDGEDDRFVTYETLLKEGRDESLKRIPHFDVDPEKDMVFFIHTSGSTGQPKCAMIPHRALLLNGEEMAEIFQSKGSVVGMVYPFGHISGTTFIPMNIINGATVVLLGDFDEEMLLKSVEKYKINVLPIYPTVGIRFAEGKFTQKYDLSSLRLITTGGAAFPGNVAKAIIDKYGVQFTEGYGMTECLPVTSAVDPKEEFIPGNLGKITPGIEAKFIHLTTGESLGPNTDGEVCLKGCKMFCGYLKEDGSLDLKSAFDSEGWYHSGDLGHYDEQGRIFITDRLKEVVRIRIDNHCVNISPVEIELFLLTHKSIAEVAVVGVNNKTGTQWPRAYVVLKDGCTATEHDIQKFVSDTLAKTKQLKGGVVFVKSIQRTAFKKVDRKYYRNLVKDEVID